MFFSPKLILYYVNVWRPHRGPPERAQRSKESWMLKSFLHVSTQLDLKVKKIHRSVEGGDFIIFQWSREIIFGSYELLTISGLVFPSGLFYLELTKFTPPASTFSRMVYKWNHTLGRFLRLTSFTECCALESHYTVGGIPGSLLFTDEW